MLSLDGLFVSQKAIHLVGRIVCVYCLIEKIAFYILSAPLPLPSKTIKIR